MNQIPLPEEVKQLEISLDQAIRERDEAQSWADKLAYAIAPESVIGEHSSQNCPWQNAHRIALENLPQPRYPLWEAVPVEKELPTMYPVFCIGNSPSRIYFASRKSSGEWVQEYTGQVKEIHFCLRPISAVPVGESTPKGELTDRIILESKIGFALAKCYEAKKEHFDKYGVRLTLSLLAEAATIQIESQIKAAVETATASQNERIRLLETHLKAARQMLQCLVFVDKEQRPGVAQVIAQISDVLSS